MHAWSRENFGSVRRKLEELRVQLANLNGKTDDVSRTQAKEATRVMNEMLYREEMMWLQRSRVSWLQEGDRNTKFFQQKAIWGSRKNKIRKLKASNGQWCDNPNQLAAMATDFFRALYTKDANVEPDHLVSMLDTRVTDEMNDDLCREFTDQEISDALFQIEPLKAPGPDGLPARFFQHNWGLLKEDIIAAVKRFFVDGAMSTEVNDTMIVLIPKIPHPESLSDFRPISLCNVLYKVVSKCLVNRLRPIL